jgi:hypothetical protein
MFRRLIMAIFRLYMKHLVSSYTKHICALLIWGREYIDIYYLLHRDQIHVSALDNDNLQDVYETLRL